MDTTHNPDLKSIRQVIVHTLGIRLYYAGERELRAQRGKRFADIRLDERAGLHIRARDRSPRTRYHVRLQGDALTESSARAQAESLARWLDADGEECGS